jgi:hypothetical protein
VEGDYDFTWPACDAGDLVYTTTASGLVIAVYVSNEDEQMRVIHRTMGIPFALSDSLVYARAANPKELANATATSRLMSDTYVAFPWRLPSGSTRVIPLLPAKPSVPQTLASPPVSASSAGYRLSSAPAGTGLAVIGAENIISGPRGRSGRS